MPSLRNNTRNPEVPPLLSSTKPIAKSKAIASLYVKSLESRFNRSTSFSFLPKATLKLYSFANIQKKSQSCKYFRKECVFLHFLRIMIVMSSIRLILYFSLLYELCRITTDYRPSFHVLEYSSTSSNHGSLADRDSHTNV